MNNKIGSMWGKWDLHVHTPESILNNNFGNDWDTYIYELFTRAIHNKIVCIGITDYFSIDGYKMVLDYLSKISKMKELFAKEIEDDEFFIERIKNILILPNIEFRIDKAVMISGKENSKLQMHVIFSNEISPQDIEENLLHKLSFKSNVTTSGITTGTLTRNNLTKFGRKLIDTKQPSYQNMSEYFAGVNGAYVELNQLINELSDSKFKNKYMILLAEEDTSKIKWDGQCLALRQEIYGHSHGIFSSNQNTIKWGMSKEAENLVGEIKPCFWGSDAHSYDNLFVPNNNNFCWIKSDATFLGLRQVLVNPEERLYIGEIPPQLKIALDRKPYTIASIEVRKNDKAKNIDNWFDYKMYLNPFMITIIGNKGSGKSAMTDILALSGNSYNIGNASFLNGNRFLRTPEKLGFDYNANITWHKKDYIKRLENLNVKLDKTAIEEIQYLPQSYIEDVCNDLDHEFQKEIDDVIFSYINTEDKEGTNSLDELKSVKTASLQIRFISKRNELEKINDEIISLENKSTKDYQDSIMNNLLSQRARLENHIATKPLLVDAPTSLENDEYSKIEIAINASIEEINENINNKRILLSDLNSSLTNIDDFLAKISEFNKYAEEINKEYTRISKKYGFKNNQFINIIINAEEINDKKQYFLNKKTEYSYLLDDVDIIFDNIKIDKTINLNLENILDETKKHISLLNKKFILNEYKDLIRLKTSEKSKKYLKYLDDLKTWDNKRKQILGELPDTKNEGSIKKYEDEESFLKNILVNELNSKYNDRDEIISDIFNLHIEKSEILSNIYKPIQSKLDSLLKEVEEKIEFHVDIQHDPNLASNILTYINQNVMSDFKGIIDGNLFVQGLINECDFNNSDKLLTFIDSIYYASYKDINKVNSLLGKNRRNFNNYIGKQEYMESNFILTLGGRKLKELSPGERGVVLLIFYLALNKKNNPLIIDQPEDNLDNQSVYKKLVPCILEAKKHRQIILVTHNPNIAIACDTEQIIYCKMDKKTNNITYESGSIENLEIRKRIVDILEGTHPAFDLRRKRYE